MTDILMPALSPTMEEGTLAKWYVKAGDAVRSGDVIAEIETDKATMEVEAVDEGVIEAILVPEGTEEVKVNTPIARLSAGAGATPSPPLLPPPYPPLQSLRSPPLWWRRSQRPWATPRHPLPGRCRDAGRPSATPCAMPWPRRCAGTRRSS